MKSWPWSRIFAGVACFLIVAGIAPVVYLFWFGHAHNFEPLSMPLPLKRGEYQSQYFQTDLNEVYQIYAQWNRLSGEPIGLDLDWKIVDANGAVIVQGTKAYADRRGMGHSVGIGDYRPKRGVRQKIILSNHQDVHGLDASQAMLKIGVPEEGLDMGYALVAAYAFAGLAGGLGVIIFLILLIVRATRGTRRLVTLP